MKYGGLSFVMTLERAIEIANAYAFKKYESLSYLKDRGFKKDFEEAKDLADALFLLVKTLNTKTKNS